MMSLTTDRSPPVKRQRTSSSPENSIIVRSGIWYDDGSVVLQAEYTQFRVHRTLLCQNSTIFTDLFSIPQPEPKLSVEGCPLVHLSDSADDVEVVLKALYIHSVSKLDDQLPIPIVEIHLRLGRKYDIPYLVDKAVLSLTSRHAMTLKEWDAVAGNFLAPTTSMIDVLNMAREYAIQTVLPLAYFSCARFLENFALGKAREDGSIARLSRDTLGICIIGRHRILEAQMLHTLSWLGDGTKIPCSDCNVKGECSKRKARIIKTKFLPTISIAAALAQWEAFSSNRLCTHCWAEARALQQAGREKMWQLLPSFFDLPPWDQLKNLDT